MTILDDRTRTVRPIFADATPALRAASPLEAPARDWTWINWTLSLLTAPGAAVLMAFALSRVAGSALCSSAGCPEPRVNASLFGLLYHGAAGVAAVTLFLAFFFATTHRRGIAVWACGWALLVADLLVLVAVF
ncbi:hypothetical protein MTER_09530 [Mycolicibacter terrae]|jgi:hypothetical protein|uniref:Transmembrane protein n=1 Tax=Mycolicibacter terrae TaxID=1788 RepID=A0AAD1HU68_9MYCO|nr:hypothetical protein [Mycolicibacter terrae]ORW95657.1 hypothetical protein AWC28_00615 [Mycolicibacter terrae]BBX21542.1 hypothetical protein MTER_09530 [Mycolicibacter terrae]SNV88116.1 Uncharacterised protein [Mycolicibacter terrae]